MNSTRSLLRPTYRVAIKEHVVERWTVPAATLKLCAPGASSKQRFVRPVRLPELQAADPDLHQSPVAHGRAAGGFHVHGIVACVPVVEEEQLRATEGRRTGWRRAGWEPWQRIQSRRQTIKCVEPADRQRSGERPNAVGSIIEPPKPAEQRARRMPRHEHARGPGVGACLVPQITLWATAVVYHRLQRGTLRRRPAVGTRLSSAAGVQDAEGQQERQDRRAPRPPNRTSHQFNDRTSRRQRVRACVSVVRGDPGPPTRPPLV